MEPVERAAALVGVTAPKMGPSNGKHPDPLAAVCSFRARQQADLPPRVWYWDGGITPGFNLLTARKAMGKSYFLMQMADCIAAGAPFLGRNTRKAKVLYVNPDCTVGQALIKDVRRRVLRDPRIKAKLKGK